jgi:hypothetical protein
MYPDGRRELQSGVTRSLTVPCGGRARIEVTIPLPAVKPRAAAENPPSNEALAAVKPNMALELMLLVRKDGVERYREYDLYTLVPPDGTRARFEGRDDRTQGNWVGVYGSQAYAVPIHLGRSSSQLDFVRILRGRGTERTDFDPAQEMAGSVEEQEALTALDVGDSVADPRVPLHMPGSTKRDPVAFMALGAPLFMRVITTDRRPHLLSLYLLDYRRKALAMDVDILDMEGHRLDTRRIDDYGNGAFVRYRFTGAVIAQLTPLYEGNPTLSAAFVDAASEGGE